MRQTIKDRALKVGMSFIENNITIRDLAKEMGYSKSTIHLDLMRLEEFSPTLYGAVRKKLDEHKDVRHLNGGEKTRKKWLAIKNEKKTSN